MYDYTHNLAFNLNYLFTHLKYDLELMQRCNLISNEFGKAETSTRVLLELCGCIPSASPGGGEAEITI